MGRAAAAHRSRSSTLATLLLFCGCAVAPPPQQPLPLEAHSIPPAWHAGAAGALPVPSRWWETFGDASLTLLVEEAVAHNHDIEAAAQRVAAAAAQARLAGAELAPAVTASLEAARQRQVFLGLRIPGTPEPLAHTFTAYGASLAISWEVDLWGRIRSGARAAVGDLQAATLEMQAAMESLAAATARAWFAALEAHLQRALAEETVRTFRHTRDLVEERFLLGTRPALDLRLAQSNLAAAQALLEARRAGRDRALRALEILLGRYPAGTVELAGDLPPPPGAAPAGLPAELLRRRPDLAAAERRLAAEDARLAAAVAGLYPRLSLTAAAGTVGGRPADLADADFLVWNVLGNLVQPVLQGGALRSRVDLAGARARERAAALAQALLAAFGEVETALAVEGALAARSAHLVRAAADAAQARELAEERYLAGVAPLTTLLEAQRRALETQSDLLAARRARLEARVDLHQALGGGLPGEAQP